ncbi:hypothetical protein Tco_0943063 [Tanacetum coccineum]
MEMMKIQEQLKLFPKNFLATSSKIEVLSLALSTDHNTGIIRIIDNLHEVQNAVKEDPTLNKKVLEAAKAYTKNSTNLTKLLTMVKTFDFPNLKSTIESLLNVVIAHNDHLAKWSKSSSSMARSDTDVLNVKKEPEHETRDNKPIPITVFRLTTKPTPKVELTESSSQPTKQSIPKEQRETQYTTPKPDRGKGIARDTKESPPKLIKASTKVCPDPDTLVLVPYEIHGKMCQLTEEQIRAHLDNEEKLGKASREARLSKPELIKIVHKVAKEARLDPKAL